MICPSQGSITSWQAPDIWMTHGWYSCHLTKQNSIHEGKWSLTWKWLQSYWQPPCHSGSQTSVFYDSSRDYKTGILLFIRYENVSLHQKSSGIVHVFSFISPPPSQALSQFSVQSHRLLWIRFKHNTLGYSLVSSVT